MNEEERAAFGKEFGLVNEFARQTPPEVYNATWNGAEWALKFAADRLARERAKALNDMTVPR